MSGGDNVRVWEGRLAPRQDASQRLGMERARPPPVGAGAHAIVAPAPSRIVMRRSLAKHLDQANRQRR